ncbi:hypothetical protein LEMLEM_LOCUS27654 [Lemmus lemmus]
MLVSNSQGSAFLCLLSPGLKACATAPENHLCRTYSLFSATCDSSGAAFPELCATTKGSPPAQLLLTIC